MKKIMIWKMVAFVCGVGVAAGGAAEDVFRVRVTPEGPSVEAALAKTRAAAAERKEIVFADGDYYRTTTLSLGVADSNLTLRAEHPGKAVLWGGVPVPADAWEKDGDRFVSAAVDGVKEGTRDFRTLLVDGRLAPRATYPGVTNCLENLGGWTVRMQSSIDGMWARKPTDAELTTMAYKKGDLPEGFEPRNADVRVFHMWNESTVNVASNDAARGVLHFGAKLIAPAGAYGRRTYQIAGIREGMTEPGQWYLDRVRGRVVYWPRSAAETARVVVPRVETVLSVKGRGAREPVRGVRVEGLVVTGASAPCRNAGFGGEGMPGAVEVLHAADCVFAGMTVRHTGGAGFKIDLSARCRLADNLMTDTGACILRAMLTDSEIVSNRLLRAGRAYSAAAAAVLGGARVRIARNTVCEAPYSGFILRGQGHVVEENHVSRVMRFLHDGAAFYGNIRDCVIRGNVVRDVVARGAGFGASAFYCDETCADVTVEGNVTVGVPRPVHQHLARDIHLRNNTFVTDGDMTISFQNCVGCSFTDNTLVAGGRVKPTDASRASVTNWSGNRVCAAAGTAGAADGHTWDCVLEAPWREKPRAVWLVPKTAGGAADGTLGADEYGEARRLDRDARGVYLGAAPTAVRLAWDGDALRLGIRTVDFRATPLSTGETWGTDDGVRVRIGACTVEAYHSGRVFIAGTGGAREPLAGAWNQELSGGMGRTRVIECAVPFARLGVEAKAGTRLPFAACRHSARYNEDRFYAAPTESAEIELK